MVVAFCVFPELILRALRGSCRSSVSSAAAKPNLVAPSYFHRRLPSISSPSSPLSLYQECTSVLFQKPFDLKTSCICMIAAFLTDLNMFQKSISMGMRMDEKEEEETEVVGQSSMEELDYEASDNLEEESMEQQSDNNTSSNVNGATEETEKAVISETENELAAVTGEPDEPVVHSVEARAGSKGSPTDSKSGNDTGARKKSSE